MNIVNKLIDFLAEKLSWVMQVFPVSPFQGFFSKVSELPYLGYINWFIPIDWIISITEAWITVIAVFYIYSIVARWVKAIE